MQAISDIDWFSISCDEARKLRPFGKNDKPVKVRCYRQTEEWKSAKAARKFYETAMMSVDPGSSECERYTEIVSDLSEGKDFADDKVA